MPTDKQKIIRQVNKMIDRIKNKTITSASFKADFADVFIEGFSSGKRNESAGERINSAGKAKIIHLYDPVQERFAQMRRISRTVYQKSMYADAYREQVFYKQAMFMADFEDNYEHTAPFQMYYPNYQVMSHEQLRTYFSWRSMTRKGNIEKTDLSYVFLYIYELINDIGIPDGDDGISKLMSFWSAYRKFTLKLDKYAAGWVKDYFVLNCHGSPFNELLFKYPLLQSFYPPDSEKYTLDYYNRISAYKIKDSIFYTPENEKMLSDCFNHIVYRLNALMNKTNRKFNDLIFERSREIIWHPFSRAIFFMRPEHNPGRSTIVELSDETIYRYRNGRWTYIKGGLFSENGRQIVSYIFRRMEQLLRRVTKFRYKLSADDRYIDKRLLDKLLPGTGSKGFLSEIDLAVKEFYINSKKTVVTVNQVNLEKIRENALITQEKLIVIADGGIDDDVSDAQPAQAERLHLPPADAEAINESRPDIKQERSFVLNPGGTSVWDVFASSLLPDELAALTDILKGASVKSMHDFARNSGYMLEVLLDKINQKALDITGDTILELTDKILIFDDYLENLRKAVKCE